MITLPRRLLAGGIIILLGTLLAGCMPAIAPPGLPASSGKAEPWLAPTATGLSGKPIKVAFITSLTGRMAGYGARQKIAVELAQEDINSSGGINGSPLQVIMVDDAADPKEDPTLLRRLAVAERVLAVIGPLTGTSFATVAPLASELQVPVITATSTEPGTTDRTRPWAFHFSIPDTATIPKALAGFKKLYPSVKRMVIAGDTKGAVTQYIVRSIYPRALAEAGFEIVGTVPFETGTTDFSAVVAKIRALDPQGIAYSSLTPEAVGMAKELQRQGVRVPVVASYQNWAGPEISLARDVLNGWVAPGTFDENTQDPRGISFVERYVRIAEADPTAIKPVYAGSWAQSYDAMMALAQVMRTNKVGPDMEPTEARTKIREGLSTLKHFQGLIGEVSMQANGDISATPLAFVAREAKWVLIE
jgi:branched-chain amino acid transport system substrate-binding protein